MPRRIILYFITIIVVISAITIALFLKTGGFSVYLWEKTIFSCHHIQNPLIIFLLLWTTRLILIKDHPQIIQPSGKSNKKRIILTFIILYWLGLKLILQETEPFSLYLPNYKYTFCPILTFITSTLFILGIVYYMYILVTKNFGTNAAIISITVFLFSPLSRINTPALLPSYIILLLFLGSAAYFTKYLNKSKPYKIGLIIGLCFLITSLLFKLLLLNMEFTLQGLWDLRLFEQRLMIAIPLPANHLFWASTGIILCIWKRNLLLILLSLLTFLWTFFVANNTLAAFLPLTCLLSIFSGVSINWLLENKLTNRTIFDRNISLSVAFTLFILFHFNTSHLLNHLPGQKRYEAENLPNYGEIITDEKASGGMAVRKNKEEAKTQSTVIFGPYHPFLSGEYEINFYILAEDNKNFEPVVKIDVVSEYGNRVFAWKRINGNDFKCNNIYQNFPIRFHLRKTQRLEFRVASYGLVDITVDKVSLKLLNRQELLSAPRYIPILMYHKIGKDAPTEWWVKTENYRRQMKEIKKAGYKTIRLKNIYNYKLKNGRLPFHPIVITFDDGYENFLTEAFPILKKYGLTATVFVITNTVGNEDKQIDNSWDQESESMYKAWHLTWPEIKWLNKKGIEIGSHTRTHSNLTQLKKSDLEKEIKDSKSILEDKLGVPIEVFSYPGGKRNSLVTERLKEAGYKVAVTVSGGIENSENLDLLNLKRIYIGPKESARELLAEIAERY